MWIFFFVFFSTLPKKELTYYPYPFQEPPWLMVHSPSEFACVIVMHHRVHSEIVHSSLVEFFYCLYCSCSWWNRNLIFLICLRHTSAWRSNEYGDNEVDNLRHACLLGPWIGSELETHLEVENVKTHNTWRTFHSVIMRYIHQPIDYYSRPPPHQPTHQPKQPPN